MKKFEPPDIHHLNAAQGWLELGRPDEAHAELELISAPLRGSPAVLEIRWQINAREKNWERCVELAEAIVKQAPGLSLGWIHRSYAMHELKQTRAALDALLPATPLFPKEWLIQYNLACYCCQLKELDRAMRFLEQAFKLGDTKQVKQMALNDGDLRELWPKIKQAF